MTKLINAALVVYGLLCIGMGVQAFFFPHEGHQPSPVSLIAAGSMGILAIGSVYLWTIKPMFGRILAMVVTLAAIGNFLPKLIKGAPMYPAGVMVILSVVVLVLLVSGHIMAKKAREAKS